jgi:hypothetical protein
MLQNQSMMVVSWQNREEEKQEKYRFGTVNKTNMLSSPLVVVPSSSNKQINWVITN